jgi:AICAR transformylase/IMP cyclohydrolase PurH
VARKSRAKPAALITTSAKSEEEAALIRKLHGLGWRIFASGGTYRWLKCTCFVPCTDIATLVGEPILGHRVVTLSRELYAGILARQGNEEDAAELKKIGAPLISLVYAGLYDLEAALKDQNVRYQDLIEKIDIGGPTLLRAAAKSGRLVGSTPQQLGRIVRVLEIPADPNPFRRAKFESGFLHQLYAEAEQAVQAHSKLAQQFYQQVADGAWNRW